MEHCWCDCGRLVMLPTRARSRLTCRTQAIASSYTYEEGEKDHPPDAVYVRSVSDVEVTAKPRAPA